MSVSRPAQDTSRKVCFYCVTRTFESRDRVRSPVSRAKMWISQPAKGCCNEHENERSEAKAVNLGCLSRMRCPSRGALFCGVQAARAQTHTWIESSLQLRRLNRKEFPLVLTLTEQTPPTKCSKQHRLSSAQFLQSRIAVRSRRCLEPSRSTGERSKIPEMADSLPKSLDGDGTNEAWHAL
jgi:hypothetical protein